MLSRQTLSYGCVKVADTLRPLYDLMKLKIIKRGIIFADKTPVKMLTEPVKLSDKVLRLVRNIYRYERAMKKFDRESQEKRILEVHNKKIRPIINELFSITADVLRRINGHQHSKLYELLPGNWKKSRIILRLTCTRYYAYQIIENIVTARIPARRNILKNWDFRSI